ncbi:MAG: dihydrofolate reductase [Patescibacteria group bacterium]
MVNIIVATAKNNVIGNKGDIPWRGQLPADMRYFAARTTNQAVIMGRTTYLSIPAKYRPLPNRLNLILSIEPIPDRGVLTFQSLQAAIDYVLTQNKDVFIAGGGSIYKEALSGSYQIDYILRTLIDADFDGDTFFPELDKSWRLVEESCNDKDGKNQFDYCFQVYKQVNL